MSNNSDIGDEFFERIKKMSESVQFDAVSDPTCEWTLDTDAELILDLDSSALSGVKVGDSLADLSFLGPCEKFSPGISLCVDSGANQLDPPRRQYDLSYASRGVGFFADERLVISSFHLYFQPDPREAGCGVFSGKVRWMDSEIGVSSLNNLEAFLSVVGLPDRDEEVPEHDLPVPGLGKESYARYLVYERQDAMWMAHFGASGRTQGLSVFGSLALKSP